MKKVIILGFVFILLGLNTVNAYYIVYNTDKVDKELYSTEIGKVMALYNMEDEFIRFEVYEYHPEYCGLQWAFTNRILLYDSCYSYPMEYVIEHELKHYIYFHLPVKEQIELCDHISLPYATECWEYYAIE